MRIAIGILYLFNERDIKSIVSFVANYHGQLTTNILIEPFSSIRVKLIKNILNTISIGFMMHQVILAVAKT